MDKVICEIRYDEGIRFFEDDICGTLRTISECGSKHVIEADKIQNKGGRKRVIDGKIRIRKLTPTECYKLMGFTAEDCMKAHYYTEEEVSRLNLRKSKKHNDLSNSEKIERVSNSQLYKQAGNSIVVNVLEAIFKSLGERYEEFSV